MTHGVSLPGIADNGWPKLGREIGFWAELRCKRMVIEQDDIGTRREEDWTPKRIAEVLTRLRNASIFSTRSSRPTT